MNNDYTTTASKFHPCQTAKHLSNIIGTLNDHRALLVAEKVKLRRSFEDNDKKLDLALAGVKEQREKVVAEVNALIPTLSGFRKTQEALQDLIA